MCLPAACLVGGEGPAGHARRGRFGRRGFGRHGDDLFGVGQRRAGRFPVDVDVGVSFEHFAASPGGLGDAGGAGDRAQRAVVRGVQVDPRYKPVPRLGVEADVVMALAEHLDQLRRADVRFHGREHAYVALEAGAADEALQERVAHGELPRVAPTVVVAAVVVVDEYRASQVADLLAVGPLLAFLAIVAAEAVLVQHGLDFAGEAVSARGSPPRRDPARAAAKGERRRVLRRVVLPLVAAHARQDLAGHGGHPAAHQLQGRAGFVERLDGDRHVGRHAEHRRAVGFDLDGAHDPPHVPRALHADHALRAAHAGIQVRVREHAEPLDGPARNAGQPAAAVDVDHVDHRVAPREVHSVGDDPRARPGPQRDRLEQRVAGQLLDQREIVEHVDEVDAPQGIGGGLAGDEEVLPRPEPRRGVAQRPGVQELRPGRVDEVVLDLRPDGLASPGDSLDGAVGLLAAAGDVEEHQLAHPRHAVVPADNADQFCGTARDRPGVEQRVGPVRVSPVDGPLLRAVGVHAEQDPVVRVRRVGVLPPLVHHPPVGEDRRAPVVLLIETQLPDPSRRAGIRAHDEQVRDARRAVDARHGDERPRRAEHDPPVGQIAGVVVVHVVVLAGRDLPQPSRRAGIRADLEHLPPVVRADRREQHPIAVEVQVHVADEDRILRLVERRQLPVGRRRRKHGDLVVEPAAGQHTIALPVLRQAQRRAAGAALDQQQLVHRQQRVGQQRFPLEGQNLLPLRDRVLPARLQRLQHVGQTPHDRIDSSQVRRPLRVAPGERRHQIAHRQAQRLGVQQRQPRDGPAEAGGQGLAGAAMGELRPPKLPAVREGDVGLQPKRADVRHAGPRAQQLDGVNALGDPQRALRCPLGRRCLPAARDGRKAAMDLLAVQVDIDRPGAMRRVQRHETVLGRDGELDLVLGLVG